MVGGLRRNGSARFDFLRNFRQHQKRTDSGLARPTGSKNTHVLGERKCGNERVYVRNYAVSSRPVRCRARGDRGGRYECCLIFPPTATAHANHAGRRWFREFLINSAFPFGQVSLILHRSKGRQVNDGIFSGHVSGCLFSFSRVTISSEWETSGREGRTCIERGGSSAFF